VDPKHGKRPLQEEEEEEEEEKKAFPFYFSRSKQDVSAVVSALVEVIGGNPPPKDPTTLSHSTAVHSNSDEPSHPPQLQGMFLPAPSSYILYIQHIFLSFSCFRN